MSLCLLKGFPHSAFPESCQPALLSHSPAGGQPCLSTKKHGMVVLLLNLTEPSQTALLSSGPRAGLQTMVGTELGLKAKDFILLGSLQILLMTLPGEGQ